MINPVRGLWRLYSGMSAEGIQRRRKGSGDSREGPTTDCEGQRREHLIRGLRMVNSSIIPEDRIYRADIKEVKIPVTDIVAVYLLTQESRR